MRIKDWFTFKLGLVLFYLCFAGTGEAKISLPNLVSDGMVLQRGCPVKIWGTADAGEAVALTFSKKNYHTVADAAGRWEIVLPALKPGGPYELQVNEVTVHDVWVGDVFLCSGQSNMELQVSRVTDRFADEISRYENPQVRYIKVPYCYDFNTQREDIGKESWKPLTKEHVMGYSALCYFFAKLLYEQTQVPVGIVNASWGGTPVEAWVSEEGLKEFPFCLRQKALYESDDLVKQIQQMEGKRRQAWQRLLWQSDKGLHDAVPWYAENYDDTGWESTGLFDRAWATNGWRPLNGSHWFRKEVDVPASWSGKEAVLRLGCMVDADSVFVNGQFAGTVAYQYPPRIYKLPAGRLKAGKNQITIRLVSNGGYPSFVREKPYKLLCEGEEVDLTGTWKHRVGTSMPPAPASTAFHCQPVGLYNGMIHPLRRYTFRGVAWYQGESNVGRWQEYAALLTALMQDWRKTFASADLPFYIIELADFLAPDDPGRKAWAELRAQQAKAAAGVPRATLIKNSDTGEWNDIHPLDKKTAAARLVEAVLQDNR